MLNLLAFLKSKTLRPSALNECSDFIIKISARDITQDWSALALVSVKTQTRNYSPPQRMKWIRQSKQKHLEGKELGCSHTANQSLADLKVSWVLCSWCFKNKCNPDLKWYPQCQKSPFHFWLLGQNWRYPFCPINRSHWPVAVRNPYHLPLFLHLPCDLGKVWKNRAFVTLHQ